MELDPSQRAAVDLVCNARVCVVTGGPGTGKTTSLSAALDALDALPEPARWPCVACNGTGRASQDTEWDDTCFSCNGDGAQVVERYVLAAPTGKAARRMMEATGRTAKTVHRLLEYGRAGFRRNATNPIAAHVIVIDESSMLDIELMASLVDAIDSARTRLILVGDVAQLPPVGPGKPFADLIASGRVPVARLTHLHRAAAESWVCAQAPRVLAGIDPDLRPRKDFRWIGAPSSGHVVPAVLKEILALAKELDPNTGMPWEVQVLAPQRKGAAGVQALNAAMQAAINRGARPPEKSWGSPDERLYVGDRVIQTTNNYPLAVMNGEVGAITGLTDAELTVDFGDREVKYSRLASNALHLAYALTVHKSQGSEWPWVVVVCHSTHTIMLTRALLYTAITRARKGVIIVGDEVGLQRAVANGRDEARNSSLTLRLANPESAS